jgi:uncharacterized heparinase superfamily protein
VYRLESLRKDIRKALSLPAGEVVRRFTGRAVRYARRVRNRRRGAISEAQFLAALGRPALSLHEFVSRRAGCEPLVPASARSAFLAEWMKSHAASSLDPILTAARAVKAGTFDLLGSGAVALGPSPDWQRDFKSGMRWDSGAYSLEIVQTPDRGHDIKVPWELSRLQHLVVLGIAQAVTGDPSFRLTAVQQVDSFLAANPAYRGVNWNCTMDVAIRASQLLASEGYLRGEGAPSFWGRFLMSLLGHARFIRENLEDGPVRGNHYLADLAGLYLCALGLAEFSESDSWRQFSRVTLEEEMRRQVHPDGFDFEASTSYHAFATEMFLFPALFGAIKQDPFPDSYLRRLEKMLEAVAALIRPDGTLPQIGDNDDGRFLIFSQYHRPRRDWRPLLALGAYLYRREAWLFRSGDAWVEGVWALGEPFIRWGGSLRSPLSPPPFASQAFPQAGVYQLGAGSLQMVVDAGSVGQGENGGHAHNDTLAFELHAFGREILPDRGTGTYTPSLRLRNRFRSTRAHNSIEVDGEEINPIPEEAFRLIPADHPRTLRWRTGLHYTYLAVEHRGYHRLPDPLVHRRRFLLDHRQGSFALEDRLEGKGHHRFQASFHLPPGWDAKPDDGGWSARQVHGEAGLRFRWKKAPDGHEIRVEEDLHSPSYGVTIPARTVRIAWQGSAPQIMRYRLVPFLGEGS